MVVQPVFKQRLTTSKSPLNEWKYLVNETLEGEKCIVPLLREILLTSKLSNEFKRNVRAQLDEEITHVRMFYDLVGKYKVQGSGYKEKLIEYCQNLPNLTLKLFLLQGMLEGYALGALEYRKTFLLESPSKAEDTKAYLEELNHVKYSFDHFEELKKIDGTVSRASFYKASKDINAIISKSFSGKNIVKIFNDSFNEIIENPNEMGCSSIGDFKKISIKNVVKNKNTFLKRYFGY